MSPHPRFAVPFSLAPPRENGVAENVVKDLVPCAVPTGAVDRPDDPLPAERGQHRHHLALVDGGVLREVAGTVGDLRA